MGVSVPRSGRLVHDYRCPWVERRAACTCGVGLGDDTANTLADAVLDLEERLREAADTEASLRRALEAERLLRAAVEESRDSFHRALEDLMEARASVPGNGTDSDE